MDSGPRRQVTFYLVSAGMRGEHIEMAGLDTFQLPERFFSHRRAQPTGRFLAFASLLGKS